DGPHAPRQTRVDVQDRLEFVECQRNPSFAFCGDLRWHREQLFERGVRVFACATCAELEGWGHGALLISGKGQFGRQRQVAEDLAEAVNGLTEWRDESVVQSRC